jgi:hypothetical protein
MAFLCVLSCVAELSTVASISHIVPSKELNMSDTEIIVTTLVVAAIFAVKVWFINRFM